MEYNGFMRVSSLLFLLLTGASRAGEQAAEVIYPIWDEENFVELYAKAVAKNQLILLLGGVLALSLLGLVLIRTVGKGQRFRFSLSWLLAFVFASSIALWGGVGWWATEKPDPYDDKFSKAFETAMQKHTRFEFDEELNWINVRRLVGNGVYVVLSPELEAAQKKINLRLADVSGKDVINRFCRLAGAGCDVRNGALLIYPEEKRPSIRKRFVPKEEWEAAVAQRLTPKVSFEMADTPITEIAKFLGSLAKISIVLAPSVQAKDAKVGMCGVRDMRLDDALTWFCFLADAEWSLRRSADGIGEIWVEPRSGFGAKDQAR